MAAGFGAALVMVRRTHAVGAVPPPGMNGGPVIAKGRSTSWPYGGNYSACRYSPLDQINPDNVAKLIKAWTFHTGDLPNDQNGAETTPLKVGDTFYLCTPKNI